MATINHVSGKSYRVCTDADNDVYDELSFETDASDVNFTDGTDAESSLGQIKGITSDITGEAEDIAASIKCVNQLNNSLTANGNRLYADYQNGKYGFNTDPDRGADTFVPFNSGASVFEVNSATSWITNHEMNIGVGFESVYLQVDSVEPASGVTYFPTKEYDKTTGVLTIYFGNKTSNYFQSLRGSVIAF